MFPHGISASKHGIKLKLALWKWWRVVPWSRHRCVFHRLEAFSDDICKIEKWCQQLASFIEKTCLSKFQINSITPFPSSPGDAKNLDCRLATFHGESVNKLKGQIGVALKGQIGVVLILKYFWWIFASEDKNFHFNKKHIYLNKTN